MRWARSRRVSVARTETSMVLAPVRMRISPASPAVAVSKTPPPKTPVASPAERANPPEKSSTLGSAKGRSTMRRGSPVLA
ncbi:MAG: hypothetical protein BWY88_00959 [Synergistetes bacterium ADurb.Bin520]|nr:MAG: hypothetical protein BWY88_00959 [Synergistetes bacterium ADurb.Bin520]